MLTQPNLPNDVETLKTMYQWLMNGYKMIEIRLAEVIDENNRLKQIATKYSNLN